MPLLVSSQVTSTNRHGNALPVLPHRLGIIKVTGLDDDHRVAVEFEHPPDQLVPLGGLGVAV